MAVVNTYFKKMEEHRVTYKSGGRSTKWTISLCRRAYLKEIGDGKVIAGENLAKQTKKGKISKAEPSMKWWKLKKDYSCEEFREEIRRVLGGREELPDDWTTTSKVVTDTARKVLGVSSKQRKEGDLVVG